MTNPPERERGSLDSDFMLGQIQFPNCTEPELVEPEPRRRESARRKGFSHCTA